ncbi:MAG: c-type cytochrome [Acidimicrobiales bacterium]
MTEIPEHLLRRSRERRAALGLGGDDADGDGEQAALPAKSAAPSAAAPAKAAAKPAPAKKAAVAIEEPAEVVTYVAPPKGPHKMRIPLFVMPVLIGIPLWAAFFPSAFSNHHHVTITDPVALGAIVYQNNCATCHGAHGEGGVGPALHGGQSVLTFPNVADQIMWVDNGSMGLKPDQPYGSPTRTGGQHKASKDDMPAFSNTLSSSQIMDVVLYERSSL